MRRSLHKTRAELRHDRHTPFEMPLNDRLNFALGRITLDGPVHLVVYADQAIDTKDILGCADPQPGRNFRRVPVIHKDRAQSQTAVETAENGKATYVRPVLVNMGQAGEMTEAGVGTNIDGATTSAVS